MCRCLPGFSVAYLHFAACLLLPGFRHFAFAITLIVQHRRYGTIFQNACALELTWSGQFRQGCDGSSSVSMGLTAPGASVLTGPVGSATRLHCGYRDTGPRREPLSSR